MALCAGTHPDAECAQYAIRAGNQTGERLAEQVVGQTPGDPDDDAEACHGDQHPLPKT